MSRWLFERKSGGVWGTGFGVPRPDFFESDDLNALYEVAVRRAIANRNTPYRILDTAEDRKVVWETTGGGNPPPLVTPESASPQPSRPSRRFQPGRL